MVYTVRSGGGMDNLLFCPWWSSRKIFQTYNRLYKKSGFIFRKNNIRSIQRDLQAISQYIG